MKFDKETPVHWLGVLVAATLLVACGGGPMSVHGEGAGDGPSQANCEETVVSADEAPDREGVECTAPETPETPDRGCSGGTELSGPIESDQTLEAGCYEINSRIQVRDAATLTIEPGVTLAFAGSSDGIVVDGGYLNAVGTDDEPIVFTTIDGNESWAGVRFKENSVSDDNVLEHVIMEQGGGFDWNSSCCQKSNLLVQSDTVQLAVRDTVFRDSHKWGMHVTNAGAELEFSNVEFTGNEQGAALIPPNQMGAFDSDSAYGEDQWVTMSAGTVSDDQTWSSCTPYRGGSRLTIGDEATVEVEPGTVVEMDGGYIEVDGGYLQAVGEPDKAIAFRGADGTAGDWGGINFLSDTVGKLNILDNVILEDGGGFDWNSSCCKNANLVANSSDVDLKVANSVIRGSSAWGVHANSGESNVRFENTLFEDNENGAVNIPADHMDAFAGTSRFEDEKGVVVRGGNVNSDQTWRTCTDYRVEGGVNIGTDNFVTVEPGTVLEFDSGHLDIQGQFNADGEPDNVIRFTGAQEGAGAWGGLRIHGENLSNNNLLDYVVIEHGGGFDWNTSSAKNANLNITGDSVRMTLSNTTIRESKKMGMYVGGEPELSCSALSIEGDPPVGGADSLEEACGVATESDEEIEF